MFTVSFLFVHHMFFSIISIFIKDYIILPLYIHIPYIPAPNIHIDYRNLIAVEHEAVRNKDKFTIERVEDARKSYFRWDMFNNEMFTFMCLLAINVWFIDSDENHTITQSIVNILRYIDSTLAICGVGRRVGYTLR
jgi:hypothetical protein